MYSVTLTVSVSFIEPLNEGLRIRVSVTVELSETLIFAMGGVTLTVSLTLTLSDTDTKSTLSSFGDSVTITESVVLMYEVMDTATDSVTVVLSDTEGLVTIPTPTESDTMTESDTLRLSTITTAEERSEEH